MKEVRYNDTMLWATFEDWPKVPNYLLNNLSLFNNRINFLYTNLVKITWYV